jgi:hypothetical protein
MNNTTLSKQGKKLIELYEQMVHEGYDRIDGSTVKQVYNDFELRKFRNICKASFIDQKIKTVLDYGAGGSDWDTPNFDPITGKTAKQYFLVDDVTSFEPARNLLVKRKSDAVVCMDVLEHVFISDIPTLVAELFSFSKKLLVVNVACYKAAAMLPNGENAHITVRPPEWWKGVFDTIASNFKDVEVFLICSTTFTSGVIFDKYKSSDWEQSKTFETDIKFQRFNPS